MYERRTRSEFDRRQVCDDKFDLHQIWGQFRLKRLNGSNPPTDILTVYKIGLGAGIRMSISEFEAELKECFLEEAKVPPSEIGTCFLKPERHPEDHDGKSVLILDRPEMVKRFSSWSLIQTRSRTHSEAA